MRLAHEKSNVDPAIMQNTPMPNFVSLFLFCGKLFGKFSITVLVTYHLDVTIVNRYGKDVQILTDHPISKYQQFVIPVGGRYQIKSRSSASKTIYISAFEADTYVPIKIDGKNSLAVANSVRPSPRTYYIPSGKQCTFPLIIYLPRPFSPVCIGA